MTLSPQDKAAVEAQRAVFEFLKRFKFHDMDSLLTADALASLLSSRAPGVGLKRYEAAWHGRANRYIMLNEQGEEIDAAGLGFYLASEVDASLPREYTADNIGEAYEILADILKGLRTWRIDRQRDQLRRAMELLVPSIPTPRN